MRKSWAPWLVAAAGLATSAVAHPGGGGGMGGGFGGGMGGGFGGGFGAGGSGAMGMGAEHGAAVSPRALGASAASGHASTGAHSAISALNNTHLDTALTKALAKGGVTVPGGDLKAACAGFGNLGGCVAALHVSKNLDLPGGFTALKGLTTGPSAVSLGKAIQQLQPSADARAEVNRANHQASSDLKTADASQSDS